ncbi:MAG: NAD(P)/FAD-dependent oxidoreductase [Anaerolineales bacterium]
MENKNVVIVGAGMAGLSAAAYLAREKYNVLLLDKNDRCGGLVNTFEYDGLFFDSGPRAFVNSGMLKPILKDLGISGEFLENKVSIGIEDQLFRVDSMESLEDYQRILCKLYPENIEEIEKIISITAELSEVTKILYEFDNPNFIDFKNDPKFIFRKLIPWTIKFLFALRKMNQFDVPMEEFLKQYTDNQSLIDVLTQLFFRKTPTYFALGYFYVYLDYFYPKGGTTTLVNLLKEKIEVWGGEIQLKKHIVEIDPSKSVVIDSEGNHYPYDHLIWAADLKTLYRSLKLDGLSENAAKEIESEKQRLLSSKGAESVYILILDWADDFLKLNTFEVSIPALRDPALAPEGKTGLMISCLFDYQIVEKIEKAGWYGEFKEFVEDRIIRIFSESIYPDLNKDVLFKFSSTPLTINKVSGSSEGAITGWSFETDIPVMHVLKDIPKSALTPIPGVFQAGQWAYAPAGVPIAMLTGWHASQEVIKSV